tara:strand:+ start:202 stop:666 length:465 start_codon:yes stop_codon:yes gene_type:complete
MCTSSSFSGGLAWFVVLLDVAGLFGFVTLGFSVYYWLLLSGCLFGGAGAVLVLNRCCCGTGKIFEVHSRFTHSSILLGIGTVLQTVGPALLLQEYTDAKDGVEDHLDGELLAATDTIYALFIGGHLLTASFNFVLFGIVVWKWHTSAEYKQVLP